MQHNYTVTSNFQGIKAFGIANICWELNEKVYDAQSLKSLGQWKTQPKLKYIQYLLDIL